MNLSRLANRLTQVYGIALALPQARLPHWAAVLASSLGTNYGDLKTSCLA
jgi:hypothetical protein